MSNKDEYWFKKRWQGFGWIAMNWRGWLVVAVYWIVALSWVLVPAITNNEIAFWIGMLVYGAVLSISSLVLLMICLTRSLPVKESEVR